MNSLHKNVSLTLTTIALAVSATAFSATSNARNNDGLSAISTLSALPVASVLVAGSVASAASTATLALPVALSESGAALVVKSVEVSARGVICVLARASDGALASIEIAGQVAEHLTLHAGQIVQVSVVAAGAVLSVAGAAIAIVPSELGRVLLHNERLTY